MLESKEVSAIQALLVGSGRMGSLIKRILEQRGHRIGAVVNSRGDERGRSLDELLRDAPFDVAFEFTSTQSAPALVQQLLSAGVTTVSGSTGWDIRPACEIAHLRGVSFMHSANFCLGVAILRRLVQMAATTAGALGGFEAAVLERHHRAKQDQPSGTALMLAAAMRPQFDVPIASFRQGGNPGEHCVYFESDAESIEITHRARSREVFARGAVLAGEWLACEQPQRNVTFEEFLERSLICNPNGVESLQRS